MCPFDSMKPCTLHELRAYAKARHHYVRAHLPSHGKKMSKEQERELAALDTLILMLGYLASPACELGVKLMEEWNIVTAEK